MAALLGAVAASPGCKSSAQWSSFGGSNSSSSSSGGSRSSPSGGAPAAVTMPDLTLMTQAEAEETLRRAGFTAAVSLDAFACGSTLDDKRVVELGRVCHQAPAPGRPASTGLAVSLRVQKENPWRGQYRAGRAWFLMPDLIGKDVELAQAKLRELGFTAKDVKIAYVVEPGCPASTVCRTSPEAWERADTTSDKIFFVGQPPESATSARPSSAPAAPKPDAAKEPPASTKPADIF
jgi:beta-lactam-binding protein with PASTA domain